MTAPVATYCVSCHADLKVRDDRTSPTHAQLLLQKRWDSCLQCHDYHGNHGWKAPLRVRDGASLQLLQRYMKDGPSPFGDTRVKAHQETPS